MKSWDKVLYANEHIDMQTSASDRNNFTVMLYKDSWRQYEPPPQRERGGSNCSPFILTPPCPTPAPTPLSVNNPHPQRGRHCLFNHLSKGHALPPRDPPVSIKPCAVPSAYYTHPLRKKRIALTLQHHPTLQNLRILTSNNLAKPHQPKKQPQNPHTHRPSTLNHLSYLPTASISLPLTPTPNPHPQRAGN